ncbi:argininosuccinate synthase domain-containing protein [Actinacidiphila sp. ITFR-21]|uniref:argininosuccinate synthase domain-containing protein n=1 Tax=Actinacidiphila sp. ITFR-21 TaxID=3075199 RepID=UPI00288BA52E|nr:argininosuccinate synthase domain-containing protein [Streptomyces sp. ITFR-21]WNI18016.1 argininosuccinate synthase [Streptomyces sp. ITFR-21]
MSGGLSSLAVASWLHGNGYRVEGFLLDIGQCDRKEFEAFAASVRAAGIPLHSVDARRAMAAAALDVVGFQASYDGGYWNTTGLSRSVIVETVVPRLREAGCTVLAHGCVGGGNDQRRFERYTEHFAPDLTVFAPWRSPEIQQIMPDRASMARHVAAAGLVCMPGNSAEHSIDSNIAGASHEDAGLEDLSTTALRVERLMGVAPDHAPDRVETVVVGVEHGRPATLDGQRLAPEDLLGAANTVAGRNGLGLIDVVEHRVNGTKCRGVYEAPGMELLSHAVRAAHETVTERNASDTARFLSRQLAVSVYEGAAHGLTARAARAGLAEIADRAGATVRLDLYKGGVVGRALLRIDPGAGVVQQRRFSHGGHNWDSAPLSVTASGVPA